MHEVESQAQAVAELAISSAFKSGLFGINPFWAAPRS